MKGNHDVNVGRLQRVYITTTLIAGAAIHLGAASGALGRSRLESLYGTQVSDPNLLVLLRHRAMLFAIIGGLLLAGAFIERFRLVALVVSLASTASFSVLAESVSERTSQIATVSAIDIALAISLSVALVVALRQPTTMRRSDFLRSGAESDAVTSRTGAN